MNNVEGTAIFAKVKRYTDAHIQQGDLNMLIKRSEMFNSLL